jgi:nitroreductase
MDTSANSLAATQLAEAFAQLVRQRRATPHFQSEPVPDEIIDTALALAGQAPSGYNFQPWRFLVLRDAGQRARLREAAFNQAKISEAPVVIVAFGQREGWKEHMDEIIRTQAARTGRAPGDPEKLKATATNFVCSLTPIVWLNRQVMIAFTYLMLAIESLGWDTAPMEGFDGAAVKKALALPSDAEVVALLAVGRVLEPDAHYPGRLQVGQIAFRETHGNPVVTAAEASNAASDRQ